ncbi:MAG: DUF935 domain-containing protein [Betaproteobacteria bacterium]|nr:DUF935 domain-containing protein [Betaproteobacteria bacterium]
MPQIIDQYGRPIERAVLAEPQSAKLARLRLEYATHPSRGLTPQRLAAILEGAEAGELSAQADLFADMEEKDGHILAEMGKRKRALLTLPWDVVPPASASAAEKKLAEEVKEWLAARTDFDDLLFDLMDAAGHAYSCIEIEWARLGRDWYPQRLHHRLPGWFQLDRTTRSELRLRDGSADGAALQPFGWIVHLHKAKSGHIARAGLHRALAWPYLFKNYGVRDLAEFLEIYGLPVRLGKYPAGAAASEKATLLKAVVEIGHNAAGVIPEGMAVELLEAAKGTHEPFVAMFDWCERTESKVILGQVLSAEAKATGLGSGVANLQSEVRDDLKVSDARQVAGTLSRDLIYPWLALNRGLADPSRAPRFVFDTQAPEDLKLYAESLPKLVGIGMQIPTAYAHERLRIPRPQEGEEVLSPPAGAAPAPAGREEQPGRAAAAARMAALSAEAVDPAHPADLVASRMAEEAAPEIEGWLEAIRTLVEEAESLEALRDALLATYGDLPAEDLARVMQAGLAVADLAGRFDVSQESEE